MSNTKYEVYNFSTALRNSNGEIHTNPKYGAEETNHPVDNNQYLQFVRLSNKNRKQIILKVQCWYMWCSNVFLFHKTRHIHCTSTPQSISISVPLFSLILFIYTNHASVSPVLAVQPFPEATGTQVLLQEEVCRPQQKWQG